MASPGSLAVLTVGSTTFPALTLAFLSSDTLKAIVSLTPPSVKVLAQVGNGELPDGYVEGKQLKHGIEVEIIRFTPHIEDLVGQADLVISHAGAGSILSFLRPSSSSKQSASDPTRQRHLIIVPNNTLMDSHQTDLTIAISEPGWATLCEDPSKLKEAIEGLGAAGVGSTSEPPAWRPERMRAIVDKCW